MRRRAESVLIGTCPALTRHHMEMRGLGMINVQDLFGVALDAHVEARRVHRAAGALGRRRANTSGSGSTRRLRRARPAGADGAACRSRPDATRHPRGSGRAESSAASRGQHAAQRLAERLERNCAANRPRTTSTSRKPRRLDAVHERATVEEQERRRDARARPAPAARRAHARVADEPGRSLHRAHRAVGIGEVAGDPRARGPRLLLRRQPAGDADADVRRADAAAGTEIDQAAVVVDIREGSLLRRSRASSRRCGRCRG